MFRIVHGGVTAGRIDSHRSSLALMIAPRSWYPKPRRASSLARAIAPIGPCAALPPRRTGLHAAPPAMLGAVAGLGWRLLSVGPACFNGLSAISTATALRPHTRRGGTSWISA